MYVFSQSHAPVYVYLTAIIPLVATCQPFRQEFNRIVAIYLVADAPRQLNLTCSERDSLIHALTITTHPSVFNRVLKEVEWNLRQESHPNFLRWIANNSSKQRLLCSRIISSIMIMLGLAAGILLALSSVGRLWRIMSAVLFMPGLSCFIAAWDGTCIVSLLQIYLQTASKLIPHYLSCSFAFTDANYTPGNCSSISTSPQSTSSRKGARSSTVLANRIPTRMSPGCRNMRKAASCVRLLARRLKLKTRGFVGSNLWL